tara:strand:- start:575 stop:1111 length:537 start_codon:yes stop_codon:yes gene_type:complete
MAFDATLKGASSTSYVALADADTYFTERLGTTTWDAASDANKQKALIMSSRYFDQLHFRGEKTTTTQALSWPRRYVPDPDPSKRQWGQNYRLRDDYMDADTIPSRVTYATCELAQKLLASPTLVDDPSLRQFKSLDVSGVVRLVINSNSLERVVDRQQLNFLAPLLENSNLAVKMKRI